MFLRPRWAVATLVVIVVVGLFLRSHRLDLYRLGPDDGSYLYSAGIHEIDRDASLVSALGSDRAWWGEELYYPHSRLHQLFQRWWYHLGSGAVKTARRNSGVFGALTAGLVGLFSLAFRRQFVRAGLFAALAIATQSVFVWYGRSGWGQTACTFWWTLYFCLGWWLVAGEHRRGAMIALGLAMAAVSTAAYGFHEMAVVHVAGMGGVAVALAFIQSRAPLARRLREALVSRRTLTWALSSLPVLFLLYGLFSDEFAQRHWLDISPENQPGFWQVKGQNLRFLFALTHIERQISYSILALAVAGGFVLARRDRPFFWYILLQLGVCTLPFLLLFKDASLVRIYLPAFVLLAMLAGEAVDGFCGLLRRKGHDLLFVGWLLIGGTWMAFVSWRTLFGAEGELGFVRVFHAPEGFEVRPHHAPHAPMIELLRERLEPDEVVGVHARRLPGGVRGDFSSLFLLMDAEIESAPFVLEPPASEWPRFLVGVRRIFEPLGVAKDGPYDLYWTDPFDRLGLYRRAEEEER